MKWVVCAGLLTTCAHSPASAAAVLVPGTLESGGRTRSYVSWQAAKGAALVISLHGRLGRGEGQAKLSGLVPIAMREGFTVVFPDGIDRSWSDARGVGPAAKQGVDDVAFLSALIDEFVAKGADPSRVYLLGMSNGGFMSLTAACRLADKLAAVASITGGLSTKLQADCPMSRPVPVALFLGTEDPLVPFNGGQVAGDRGEVTSAGDAARFFAGKNGCSLEPEKQSLPDLDPSDGTRVEQQVFGGCGAPVELFVVTGGGHAWPGSQVFRSQGRASKDLDASEAAWAFFKRFAR